MSMAMIHSGVVAFSEKGKSFFLIWMASIILLLHPWTLAQYGRKEYDHTLNNGSRLTFSDRVRNSIASTFWAVYEVYRDPELLASIRAEVDTCAVQTDNGLHFNINHLLRLPLLQAVYAETLRLRMHFYIIRMPDREDINIREWILPRQKVIVTPTTVAHMDPQRWNTGLNGERPLNHFWVGRFLQYPLKSIHKPTPEFSTKGLEGSWIPYGGGPRQCPGRHFAKRQILLTIALTVSLFDCEVLEKSVQEDFTLWGFGSGVSNPVGSVPIRIRRRRVQVSSKT